MVECRRDWIKKEITYLLTVYDPIKSCQNKLFTIQSTPTQDKNWLFVYLFMLIWRLLLENKNNVYVKVVPRNFLPLGSPIFTLGAVGLDYCNYTKIS